MATSAQPPNLFESLAEWLLDQGISDTSLEDLIAGMGRRLVAGGVALHRISAGSIILHPVNPGLSITWEAAEDTVNRTRMPHHILATEGFKNAPFNYLFTENIPYKRFRLENGLMEPEFLIFESLREAGVTDYVAMRHSYNRHDKKLWTDIAPGVESVSTAYATRRIGGFSDFEIAGLRYIPRHFSVAFKMQESRELAETLLDTYLGAYSSEQVLDGLIRRGDGTEIDCVLWYCDLRDSTSLADTMAREKFLGMLNEYFDHTVGAVLDHGGEVLRFIGDAVIAIFPFEAGSRTPSDMARAAVATAREAIARIDRRNAELADADAPPIRFGISMHVGSVMYGNIGTDKRLEFSVIGPAANEVVRLEGLCKKLKTQVIASAHFNEIGNEPMVSLATHPVAGVAGGLEAFTLPEFVPDGGQDQAADGNVVPLPKG